MIDNAPMNFLDETPSECEPWQLLIVDDDSDIHDVTKLALRNLEFKDRRVSFTSAYSANEAIDVLKKNSQFAVILLDIGMETKDAGLEVVNFLRKQLQDDLTRVIIRTGQHGNVPEKDIVNRYDINDYKSKTELTIDKLFTTIRTAISQYNQIKELSTLNKELEQKMEKAIQRQKEQQNLLLLQSRNSQMNELLDMIAHQWRQPLTCISAVTAHLKLSFALNKIDLDKFSEQVDLIENYTSDLSKIISEFQTIYRPSQHMETIDIATLLNRCSSIISNSFKNQQTYIEINCNNETKEMFVPSELYQVILNILKNSQEAFVRNRIKDSKIIIAIAKIGKGLKITVEDNAGGIEKNILEKIYDPYFSTKESKNGQGLGLYINKNIIEQHYNGKLSALNTKNGVLFTITLPLI